MIANIIDNRKRHYRWKRIDAIVEPVWHDNTCKDTDQYHDRDREAEGIGYEELEKVSLQCAVTWANAFKYMATLYLYDAGEIASWYRDALNVGISK